MLHRVSTLCFFDGLIIDNDSKSLFTKQKHNTEFDNKKEHFIVKNGLSHNIYVPSNEKIDTHIRL